MTYEPTQDVLAAALEHAAACQPNEACGVVIGGTFYSVPNKSTEHDAFLMDPAVLVRLEKEHGDVEAYVHSHVFLNPIPSEADRAGCEKSERPWVIVSWPTAKHTVIEPCGWRAPLVGRTWAWGTHDCYGLVKDGVQEYAGITMPDFYRDWEWWKRGGNTIIENFENAHFHKIPIDAPWRQCDVAGMQIRAPVVNHLGLFIEPEFLLHQMMGRMSVKDVFGGFYRDVTVLHLRHENFID